MKPKAYLAALNYLAKREYSQQELCLKLEAKGFLNAAIVEALALLKAEGLQSDERFCQSYIQVKVERGYGPVRIRYDLKQRGLSDALIEKNLAVYNNVWIEQAFKAFKKRFHQLEINKPKQLKQKQFLYYRGFDFDTIDMLFRELTDDSSE